MNYLDLIIKFWHYNQKYRFGAVTSAVYLYILQKWDEANQLDLIQISDIEICQNLNLTRPTVKSSRDKLLKFGLVQFQIKNGLPTHYRIVIDYFIIEPNGKIQKEKVENRILVFPNPSEKNTLLPSNYQNSHNLNSALLEVPNTSEAEEPKKEKKIEPTIISKSQKPLKKVVSEFIKDVPTLDEFKAHAKTLSIYAPEYDFSIEAKYEQWLADGWNNGMGKPIKNWKASLKSTFPYLKKINTTGSEASLSIPTIKRPKTYNE